MAVRAINTASDAEIATCVTNWNTQAALINTPDAKLFDLWTPETCRLFLSLAFAHRIDTANNSFAVATFDPELNEYDFVGYIQSTLGVARCMRALCQLLPGTAIVRGDVSPRSSQTLRTYFQMRYTANAHPRLADVTRYRSTAANIVSRA